MVALTCMSLMLVIGICFSGTAVENSKLPPTTAGQPRFHNLKQTPGAAERPATLFWAGRYPMTPPYVKSESCGAMCFFLMTLAGKRT